MIVMLSRRAAFVQGWYSLLELASPPLVVSDEAAWMAVVKSSPSLVILDFALLVEDAIGQLRAWRALSRGSPLLLAGTTFVPEREIAALAAGVAACADERLPATELKKITDVVLRGGVWVSGASLPQLLAKLQAGSGSPAVELPHPIEPEAEKLADRLAQLTERQRDVAHMIAAGASNKDIARKLNIAERTVKAHLTAIYERLQVNDRLQLALLLKR